MSQAATAPRPKPLPSQQPDFWKKYSPRGECPLSFAGSLLMHVLLLAGIVVVSLGIWGLGTTGENSKPPQMDVVEIEGAGGGLGGLGVGVGKNKTGESGRREGVEVAKGSSTTQPLDAKYKDFKFDKLPNKSSQLLKPDENPADFKDDGVFAILDQEQERGKAILAKELVDRSTQPKGVGAGFKGGGQTGPPGGAGGQQGSGFGKGKGAGQGDSPVGAVLQQQRREELRWKIIASDDGDVHVKKLQALRVILMIPLRSKPGYALRFDLSKQNVKGEVVKAQDDAAKVRWKNDSPIQMLGLAKALHLPEVPVFSVIYLPSDLEADMARRELAHQGRQEWEIERTDWDVLERDGVYDNEPTIVRQFLRSGVQ